MKINKGELLKALQLTSKAISSRPIVPLLSNILFEFEEDNARLSATNYELSIRTNISATGGGSFTAAIPAKLTVDFINLAQGEVIDITFSELSHEMIFKTDTADNKINCIKADEFPSIIEAKDASIVIPVQAFCNAVSHVSFCASSNSGLLNGVQILIEGNKLVFFATDGFRLSYEELLLDKEYSGFPLNVVIPSLSLETISRIFEMDGDLEIIPTGTQVHFRSGRTYVIAQKLDGQFPDYKLLKAKEEKTSVTISTTDFLKACKQVELFSESGISKIEVEGMFTKLSANTKELGNSVVSLLCSVSGEPITIGVNALLMRQFLEICATKNTVVKFSDFKSPIIFRMENFNSYYHIIMPMAL